MSFGLMANFEAGVLNVSCPGAGSSDIRRELEGQASEQERLAAEDLSASSALFLCSLHICGGRRRQSHTKIQAVSSLHPKAFAGTNS